MNATFYELDKLAQPLYFRIVIDRDGEEGTTEESRWNEYRAALAELLLPYGWTVADYDWASEDDFYNYIKEYKAMLDSEIDVVDNISREIESLVS